MEYLGLATALVAFVALVAAASVMIRGPRVGTPGERGLWVAVIFLLPILGPLLYISRRRRDGGNGDSPV